ncbi:MAG TPA: PHP domain-containing protein, partial [Anaerolineaceae bacterium]|nr:PHP domain-containing protein [Anaerolineaceae bacterium]
MSTFAPLHVHSCYSLLDGLASPAELVQAACACGMPALAMTDRLCLAGAVEFQTACTTAGIQPIFGLEVDMAPPRSLAALPGAGHPRPLVLLAADSQGWANLCRLTALLLDDPTREQIPPVALEVLAGYAQGVICLSGGRRSLIHHLLSHGLRDAGETLIHQLSQIFPQRFYIELNLHTREDAQALPFIITTVRRIGLPLVAAHDSFYLRPEQSSLHRTLTAIRLNTPLARLEPALVLPRAHFPDEKEMQAAFKDYPEAIANSLEVAQRCSFQLPLGQHLFPAIDVPDGLTPAGLLRRKAEAGARRYYLTITPEIQERLDRELRVICDLGFEPIFLIMEEIIAYAHSAGIPASSRGSAASSLVAHCLG